MTITDNFKTELTCNNTFFLIFGKSYHTHFYSFYDNIPIYRIIIKMSIRDNFKL